MIEISPKFSPENTPDIILSKVNDEALSAIFSVEYKNIIFKIKQDVPTDNPVFLGIIMSIQHAFIITQCTIKFNGIQPLIKKFNEEQPPNTHKFFLDKQGIMQFTVN